MAVTYKTGEVARAGDYVSVRLSYADKDEDAIVTSVRAGALRVWLQSGYFASTPSIAASFQRPAAPGDRPGPRLAGLEVRLAPGGASGPAPVLVPPFSPDTLDYSLVSPADTPTFEVRATFAAEQPGGCSHVRAFQAVPGYGLQPLSCGDGVVCTTTAWLPTPYVCAGTTGEMQIVLTSDAARAAPLRSALGAYTPFYTIYVDRSGEPPAAQATCAHADGQEMVQGEVWGGGSGTCQVEMLTQCVRCGHALSRWIEHRD